MEQITSNEFGAKYSSKQELEKFLRYSCKAYLPPHKHVNIYFYEDIVCGKKKVSLSFYFLLFESGSYNQLMIFDLIQKFLGNFNIIF